MHEPRRGDRPSTEDTDIQAMAAWANGASLRRDLLRFDLSSLADLAEHLTRRTGDRWTALEDACSLQGGAHLFGRIASCRDDVIRLPASRVIPSIDECPVCGMPIKHRYRKDDGFFPGVTCMRGHFTKSDVGAVTRAATHATDYRLPPSAGGVVL